MDLWDWFIDLWFVARLREYFSDRAYRQQRERAWSATEIAVARENDRWQRQ
ncbi:MAG TPA: hypothetical protein VHD81_06135 [Mycobacteriales bacterium]|nr:hypothetical protein [Mycobacteriales bacterium]